MAYCQEQLFVLKLFLQLCPYGVCRRAVAQGRKGEINSILPIWVGNSYPYRLQLTPPLVYCPFPLAALNKELEIDWFFGASSPLALSLICLAGRVFTP
jgi:hypothetical protein